MVRKVLIFLFTALYSHSYSQELQGLDSKEVNKNEKSYDPFSLFSATISPGKMVKNGLSTVYINGFLELKDKSLFSYRGDVYQLISFTNHPKSTINPIFLNRLLSGLFSHYIKKNMDVYVGIQGGMSFCYFNDNPLTGNYKWSYSPTLSIKTGVRLYIWKYANFYFESAYFQNYINNASFGSANMNEVVFSGGLGFQIERQKRRKTKTLPGTPSF